MHSARRIALAFLLVSTSTSIALFAGCGGDDTNGGTSSGDSGPSDDGTTRSDGAPNDSGKSDAALGDSGDAATTPPHVVFVTSIDFTGDLIAEALAVDADAGLDAGDLADAGDAGPAYLAASDVLCTHVAHAAGLSGSYAAILSAGSDLPLARFTDADGPWALVNGTPIADTVSDLRLGIWRNAIDVTEKGDTLPYVVSFVWGRAFASADCSAWTSTAGSGGAGSYIYTSHYGLNDTSQGCSSTHPLYCAEVGPGAGANRYPAIPAGGKLAFVVDESLPASFGLADAGVLDAAAPDAGDNLHTVADAICTEYARGKGKTGTYHAWVSSSTTDAKTFFMNHSMNGPWYRDDGFEIAATLSELTTTGARTQVETEPDGVIAAGLGNTVLTGTLATGTLSNNCSDFTITDASDFARQGRTAYKSTDWTDGNSFNCSNPGGLYCFEQ